MTDEKQFHLDLPDTEEPTDVEQGRWEDRDYRKDYSFFSGIAQPMGGKYYGRVHKFRRG